MDYGILRKKMVEEQLRRRDIKDERVLAAFEKVERHLFVPEDLRISSYGDYPVPIGDGQTISQPYIVALMTQALSLSGNEKILEIGTGSGYQTAILAELGGQVYSIERSQLLIEKAEQILHGQGYANVHLRLGDGTLGWPEEAPFECIIITAAAPRVPLPLAEQLSENGKLIVPQGETLSQALTLYRKVNSRLEPSVLCGCVFVPLIGKYGMRKE